MGWSVWMHASGNVRFHDFRSPSCLTAIGQSRRELRRSGIIRVGGGQLYFNGSSSDWTERQKKTPARSKPGGRQMKISVS